MKLIVLRGDPNQGKTTTLRLVYDILLYLGAQIAEPRTPGRNTDDFKTVLDYKEKRIAISSMGDLLYDVEDKIGEFAGRGDIDVLIIASRLFSSLDARIGSYHPIYREKLPKSDSNNIEDARFIINHI